MENRKVFLSDVDNKLSQIDKKIKNITLVNNIEDCTDVLVTSCGISGLFDLTRAVELGKNLYLYDEDGSFSTLRKNLSVGHLITNIDQLTENDEINQMISGKDEENERSNNGESSKLL